MDNIIIIEENIDVKPFLDEMDVEDWDWVSTHAGVSLWHQKHGRSDTAGGEPARYWLPA